jgi:hypothetical protein
MSFQQKNVTVTLVNFSLILLFFMFRMAQMLLGGTFTSENVFRLFWIVIVLAVVVTIGATILTHIVSAIIEAIRTGSDDPEIEDFEDERDRLIGLRGTSVTYSVSSLGAFVAMLTFVLGQPPLVMFSLLLLFGLVAQVVGDATRLALYRRGF